MSLVMSKRAGATVRRGDIADAIQYRVIYTVCFVVFLAAAVIARVMPWNWPKRKHGDTARQQSIFNQAGVAASTCTTYAFMS
jgi:hypothetical protein